MYICKGIHWVNITWRSNLCVISVSKWYLLGLGWIQDFRERGLGTDRWRRSLFEGVSWPYFARKFWNWGSQNWDFQHWLRPCQQFIMSHFLKFRGFNWTPPKPQLWNPPSAVYSCTSLTSIPDFFAWNFPWAYLHWTGNDCLLKNITQENIAEKYFSSQEDDHSGYVH